MRISDWSSDVCSSDLGGDPHALDLPFARTRHLQAAAADGAIFEARQHEQPGRRYQLAGFGRNAARGVEPAFETVLQFLHIRVDARRSEEHTSELQSLMRISYAVFCLNKKKQYYKNQKP